MASKQLLSAALPTSAKCHPLSPPRSNSPTLVSCATWSDPDRRASLATTVQCSIVQYGVQHCTVRASLASPLSQLEISNIIIFSVR